MKQTILRVFTALLALCIAASALARVNGAVETGPKETEPRVTEIPANAHKQSASIVTFEVPEGVVSIGESAFERCKYMTSITIPDSVTKIGAHAFEPPMLGTSPLYGSIASGEAIRNEIGDRFR